LGRVPAADPRPDPAERRPPDRPRVRKDRLRRAEAGLPSAAVGQRLERQQQQLRGARLMLAQATQPFAGPSIDWWALSPLLVLLGGGLFLLVAAALSPAWPRGWYALGSCITSGAGLVLSIFLWHDVSEHGDRYLVDDVLRFDHFALFIWITIFAAGFLASLLSDDFLRREEMDGPEVYGLFLMSALGGLVMAAANDLIVLFLGFECLSIALYVLAASNRRRAESSEAGIKYF